MSAVVPRKVVYVQGQLQESLMNNSEPKKNLFTLKRWGNEQNVVVFVFYLIKNCPWDDLTTTTPVKNNPCKLFSSSMVLKVVVDP